MKNPKDPPLSNQFASFSFILTGVLVGIDIVADKDWSLWLTTAPVTGVFSIMIIGALISIYRD